MQLHGEDNTEVQRCRGEVPMQRCRGADMEVLRCRF